MAENSNKTKPIEQQGTKGAYVYDIDALEKEVEELRISLDSNRPNYIKFKNLKQDNIFLVNRKIFALSNSVRSDIHIGLLASEECWCDYLVTLSRNVLPLNRNFRNVEVGSTYAVEDFSVNNKKDCNYNRVKFISTITLAIGVITTLIYGDGSFGSVMTGLIRYFLLSVFVYNIAYTILDYLSFIVGFNMYTNKIVDSDGYGIIKHYEEKQSLYDMKKELLEAAKATRIKPERIMDSVKRVSVNGMREEIEEVREQVATLKNTVYQKHLDICLDKCIELLNHCGTDSKALSEISSIYNIYVREVIDTIMKYGDTKEVELLEMLDNFEKFMDGKLRKYRNMNELAFKSDIGTLNSIFTSDSN